MAKETKFIEVTPDDVNSTIEIWQNFGWELIGAPQEVKTQDVQIFTKQDRDGTEHYKTTKGVHYVKITFQRDKSMPHYDELVQLEDIFYTSSPIEPSEPEKPEFGCIWIILTIVGFIMWIIPGIIIIICRNRWKKKAKKAYDEEYIQYKKNHEKWVKAYTDWKNNRENAFTRAGSLIQ